MINLEKDKKDEEDIIDEAIKCYWSQIYFKNFEIEGGADRLLVYIIVVINNCLKLVTTNKEE